MCVLRHSQFWYIAIGRALGSMGLLWEYRVRTSARPWPTQMPRWKKGTGTSVCDDTPRAMSSVTNARW